MNSKGPNPKPGAEANAHLPVSTLLPVSVRDALIKAATTPGLSEKDRRIAISKATQQARRSTPKLYKEIDHENQA